MALACDIIIAAESARFGLPEPTVGFMASSGGAQRLPRYMPFKAAMGYMLTAKQMTSHDALRWGLVNEVVPQSELLPTAKRWAEEILRCAPLSIRATKEAATRGHDMPLIPAIEHIYHNQLLMMKSEDFIEGPLAFAEKRKPNWTAQSRKMSAET
jgi:crotonobetainyl-CoA hydratase